MNERLKTKELILSGLLIAVGILLPMIFHSVGMAGKIFLPIHIPVLIGGFLLSPPLAFIVGFITPILSGALTGMPVIFPIAVIMAFELGVYGLIASLMFRKLTVIPSLIISMISGRLIAGLVVYILAQFFGVKMNAIMYLKGAVVTGLPGIAIQILLLPVLIYGLRTYKKYDIGLK